MDVTRIREWLIRPCTGREESMPDSGARIVSSYVSKSPYLRFNVNFKKTGTHYVWLQGSCLGSDNTAHAGLNGNASSSSANIKLPVNTDWVWSGTTAAGSRAKISVSKTKTDDLCQVRCFNTELVMIIFIFGESDEAPPLSNYPTKSTQI